MNNFDKVVNRYGTYSTQWDYVQDRFGESNLLPFSISDTDFEIPQGTKEVLKKAVERGVFGYTRWNHQDFKGAITQWFKKYFSCELEDNWVVYSPSVIYSLSICIQLLGKRNKKIVTLTPCYDAFFNCIRENDGELIKASLKLEDGRFKIDFSYLEKIFQTENPAIFLLCNPHNPTGRSFSIYELKKIIQLCNQYKVAIISDEIHMDVRRKEVIHNPILKFAEEIETPVVLLSSASKTFNIPGLGCSYGIIPEKKLREEFLQILKGRDGLSSVPYLGMLALQDCYNNEGPWLKDLNEYIDKNFSYVYEKLKDNKNFQFLIPESTYLGWIKVNNIENMDLLQKTLIHDEKVAIMPGITYGIEGASYLRLNLGAPLEKISLGIEALIKSVDVLAKSN